MTRHAGDEVHHYHAVNTSLTEEEAAQCVYKTRPAAVNMVKIFVQLAGSGLTDASVRETGDHQYEIRERGKVYRVGIEKCRKTDCPEPQPGRGRA